MTAPNPKPRPRPKQAALPLQDMRATPEHWRIAAETAMRDPFHTHAEREKRRDYYLAKAAEAER